MEISLRETDFNDHAFEIQTVTTNVHISKQKILIIHHLQNIRNQQRKNPTKKEERLNSLKEPLQTTTATSTHDFYETKFVHRC